MIIRYNYCPSKMSKTFLGGQKKITGQKPTKLIVEQVIHQLLCQMGRILLMEEILPQLRLVVYPIFFKVLYIAGGCLGFLL